MDLYHLLAIFLCYSIVLSNGLPRTSNYPSLLLEPNSASLEEPRHDKESKRYEIVKLDFERVTAPYIISLWIAIVGLAKIGKLYFTLFSLMHAFLIFVSIDDLKIN